MTAHDGPSASGPDPIPTITQMQRVLDNARVFCERTGSDPDETPWVVGLISTEPAPPEAIERGRQLAREHGWSS